MYTHKTKVRVRYGETDQMGYLYYGNYALYYEVGRAEAIRHLGITYKELEETYHIKMPVLYLESKFLAPAHYDEDITVETLIKEQPTKMIRFDHRVYNEKEQLLNKGVVKLFFVDMKNNKRVSTPPYVGDKIAPYFE